MSEFIKELEELLKKHNAAIVRSAGPLNKLVISVGKVRAGSYVMTFIEYEFEEEITEESIKYKRYQDITK